MIRDARCVLYLPRLFFFFFSFLVSASVLDGSTDRSDASVLQALLQSVDNPSALGWSGDDPCGSNWKHVKCVGSAVTELQLGSAGLSGRLPSTFHLLKNLRILSLQGNSFSGPLPSFTGLSNLEVAYLGGNQFDSIPSDFFTNLPKLSIITLDDNPLNKSNGWTLPDDLASSTPLSELSLTNTSLTGTIPSFLGTMRSLRVLRLAYNTLSGSIPSSFNGANLVQFQVNNQQGVPPLSGSIDVVGTMQSLSTLWLQVNNFSGTIPKNLGSLVSLKDCRLNDNSLVGPIPSSMSKAASLIYLSVKNNLLDGPIPNIPSIMAKENYTYTPGNYFCANQAGADCAPQVEALLSFLGGVGYPPNLVTAWSGNNPCSWAGINCDPKKQSVTAINLPNSHLAGIISPDLANLTSLNTLILSGNNLTGTVPPSLTSLQTLATLDVRNNDLYGPLPSFPSTVSVLTAGNKNINTTLPPSAVPTSPVSNYPPNTSSGQISGSATSKSSVPIGAIIGAVLGVIAAILVIGTIAFILFRRRAKRFQRAQGSNAVLLHPNLAGDNDDLVKVNVGSNTTNGLAGEVQSHGESGPSEMHVVEVGNLIISIEVLRKVTNNFSDENILGKGGFGVVYKGELDDGTKIAVKRMEPSVVSNKALNEFQAEIAVLTKVRHRHLVALLGYCTDGNERLLVYEYMPLGTLGQHLFEWSKLGLPPLNWNRRLSIALDVARGMEYLHGLAHKSFIHRDLKPSNILLGDDYRAKVSDFGLVKLAPEGKFSVETRLAGTFGYLAPEYAVTGRVTTKADVFSFGVILMELITGRRALDETQPEESMHLVTWFRKMSSKREAFMKAIDPVLEVTDESFQSICKVAELAGHCTAREPYQRPDMGHGVNVLSTLVEQWKPTDTDGDDGIDLDMTLPQALKKWQESSGDTSSFTDLHASRASIPPRPTGFAESFTSSDGR